jgi:hypothetical protein
MVFLVFFQACGRWGANSARVSVRLSQAEQVR